MKKDKRSRLNEQNPGTQWWYSPPAYSNVGARRRTYQEENLPGGEPTRSSRRSEVHSTVCRSTRCQLIAAEPELIHELQASITG
ncbi:hypothetical protein EYF80_060777 [Liparis tanakae]|uniref:Uncharacterized protein n=1 Tax=Liparis tanakae TaxID=230148 RepID=A0A4Z2EK05_9TELE|nr:hypothetical protein EYF80_060777 [Liparis tanakae]